MKYLLWRAVYQKIGDSCVYRLQYNSSTKNMQRSLTGKILQHTGAEKFYIIALHNIPPPANMTQEINKIDVTVDGLEVLEVPSHRHPSCMASAVKSSAEMH